MAKKKYIIVECRHCKKAEKIIGKQKEVKIYKFMFEFNPVECKLCGNRLILSKVKV